MRIKLLLISLIAAVGVIAFVAPSMAQASTRSTIEGGDIYRVRNVTKGTDFRNTTSADKCDELEFRVRIQNTGSKNSLNNVKVRTAGSSSSANQHTSTVTIKATNAHADPVSDTATINLPDSSKITYVSGSTQLLNPSGKVLQKINDMSSDTGVIIDSVGPVKDRRFVQFKVKVDCTPKAATPVAPSKPSEPSRPSEPVRPAEQPAEEKRFAACTALSVVAIDRTHHTLTATADARQQVQVKNYVFTVKRQDGAMVDKKTVTANSRANTAEYQFNQSTPGVYTVSAVANTDVSSSGSNSTSSTSSSATSSASCTQQITVHKESKEEVAPPATPVVPKDESGDTSSSGNAMSPSSSSEEAEATSETAPSAPTSEPAPAKETTTLPATGAGVAGVFVGVSALSSIVYYIVSRKFSV